MARSPLRLCAAFALLCAASAVAKDLGLKIGPKGAFTLDFDGAFSLRCARRRVFARSRRR